MMFFFSLCGQSSTFSRAECPKTCQSTEGAGPGPPASGRRSVEGPGSSGNEVLPLDPEYDSEGAQLWRRTRTGCSPGGLSDNISPYFAAPPHALSPSIQGLALWMDRDKDDN